MTAVNAGASGIAYVYERDVNGLIFEKRILRPDPTHAGFFGDDGGEIDGSTVFIGDAADSQGGDFAGAVYFFELD